MIKKIFLGATFLVLVFLSLAINQRVMAQEEGDSSYCQLFKTEAECDPFSCDWNGSCQVRNSNVTILPEELAPQPATGFLGESQTDAYGQLATTDSFSSLLAYLLNTAMGFVGIMMLIGMVYGGYLWMFAMGEEAQVEKAKKIILYTVIGFIVILSSWAIINTLLGLTNPGSIKLRIGPFDSL